MKLFRQCFFLLKDYKPYLCPSFFKSLAMRVLYLFSLTMFLLPLAGVSQQKISIDSLAAYIGQEVTVCSNVAGIHTSEGDKPVTYLSLGAAFPNQKMSVVIFQKTVSRMTTNPAEFFKNKDLCITGTLQMYHDKPQIVVIKPGQIVFNKK